MVDTKEIGPIVPDSLVDHLIENLALNGDEGASLDDLWLFAQQKIPPLDDFQKGILWQWLMAESEHVRVGSGATVLELSELDSLSLAQLVEKHGVSLRVYATEEDQWMYLTGRPKEGNALGFFPFQLLCAVSRARERGLTSVELAKETGQDPRSLYGRVTKLIEFGLIQRFPVIHSGMSTHLNVYKKFVKENREAANPGNVATGVDMHRLRHEIVALVKEGEQGKAGIRQHDDLKKQLKFDVSARSHIMFSQCVRTLESQGYVKRVITQPAGREERYRCVKFLKDLPEVQEEESEDEFAVELMNEVNSGGDENEGDLAPAINPAIGLDMTNLDDALIKEEEIEPPEKKDVLLNFDYPFETQVRNLINLQGTEGLPAMEMSRRLVGKHYSRLFSRLLETLVDKNPKKKHQPEHLGYLDILRGTDSDGRIKYYRYYTQETYRMFRGMDPDPVWGTFGKQQTVGKAHKNLATLERSFGTAMPGVIEVRQEGSSMVPLFHGEKYRNVPGAPLVLGAGPKSGSSKKSKDADGNFSPASASGKKRGRPRKRPLSDDEYGATPTPTPKKRGRPKKGATRGSSRHSQRIQEQEPAPELQPEQEPEPEAELVPEQEPVEDANVSRGPMLAPGVEATALPEVDINQSNLLSEVGPMNIDTTNVDAVAPEIVEQTRQEQLQEQGKTNPESSEDQTLSEQTVMALSTPRYKKPSKKRILRPADDSLAFAVNKRQNLIMKMIEQEGGAVEHSAGFVRKLNDADTGSGTSIDRKTVERQVNNLLTSGKLRKLAVTFPNARGIHITKSILLMPGVDDDSDMVQQIKDHIRQQIEKPAITVVPRKGIEKEEAEVGFAFKDVYERFKRGGGRREKRGTRPGNKSNAASRRLANADQARRSRKRGSSKRKADGNEDEDEGVSDLEKGDHRSAFKVASHLAQPHPTDAMRENVREQILRFPKPQLSPAPAEAQNEAQAQLAGDAEPTDSPARRKRGRPKGSISKKFVSMRPADFAASTEDDQAVSLPETASRQPRQVSQRRNFTNVDPRTGRPVRRKRQKLKDVEPDLFYRVVIVVKTLSSIVGRIDWDAIGKTLMQLANIAEPAEDQLKHEWSLVRDRYGGQNQVNKASQAFEKLLLEGYKRGELPLIEDFDNLDIATYATYWKENDSKLKELATPPLPNSRTQVDKIYLITRQQLSDPLEHVYAPLSMAKTDEFLTGHSFSFIEDHYIDGGNPESQQVKQSIKAVLGTEPSKYSASKGKEVLDVYDKEQVNAAVQDMERDKLVVYTTKHKGGFGPGRNFTFSDKFMFAMSTLYSETVLGDANKHEKEIAATVNGGSSVQLPLYPETGMMVSGLEHTVLGNVSILREGEERMIELFLANTYSVRKLDKDGLDCEVGWTAARGKRIQLLTRPQVPIPLGSRPAQNFWTDIYGEVNVTWWTRIIQFVLWMVAMRPGISVEYLTGKTKMVLTLQEMELVVDWLEKRGNIERLGCNGLRVLDQWYVDPLGIGGT